MIKNETIKMLYMIIKLKMWLQKEQQNVMQKQKRRDAFEKTEKGSRPKGN